MPRTHHVIRADVKEQILKRLKEEGVPVAKLAEEHGISAKTIYGWLSCHALVKLDTLSLSRAE